MPFTAKQREFLDNANHRWNIKEGATRSGKTYLDYFVIPKRIRRVAGLPGLTVILGNTKGTLQRNVIEPLQDMYGTELVSSIRSDNTAMLFGEKCYCLGADKANQVDRIRGASIKYCYGDEIATWHEDVFTMLKSRLDKPYSKFDGTLNPEGPHHWFKRFLESDADIYRQSYTIDDNPTLDHGFVESLKREYAGTVYYDRYILGRWKSAEGAIYRHVADTPGDFILYDTPPVMFATIGVDFGGNGSATAFNCTGYTHGMREVVTLKEYYKKGIVSPAELERDFVAFVQECKRYFIIGDAYCDSAEQTLIQGLRVACAKAGVGITIHNARKGEINDRIRFFCRLQATGRYKIMYECKHTLEAFQTAVWDAKHITEDVRLDDGTYNIDSLDAQEYAVEPYMRQIITVW
ncbi:PBSX family phage terminase large subunit [Subdoligranulum sp. AF14-43]|nr:PBSX family phage terminase large subunit [Subdoligranulum sp. AF14-43]DAK96227.1 MAG TPA: large terminase [Caudoviricetes sp.]